MPSKSLPDLPYSSGDKDKTRQASPATFVKDVTLICSTRMSLTCWAAFAPLQSSVLWCAGGSGM